MLSQDSNRRSTAYACPLCGRPIAHEIRHLNAQIDHSIAPRLRSKQPGWSANLGACPECVQQAAEAARLARSQTSLQEELMLPYPAYAPDETRLIPTHYLVNAIPGYTGEGVTLAFLDSGFYPHPDLTRPENRILCHVDATGLQPLEKEVFNKPHLTSWHGLMTSCVAAGNGHMSDHLYHGIAHQANLVLVKTGHPEGRGIREADIHRSLSWVIANQQRFNIKVINISLGGDHPANGKLSELDQLVEEAVDRGMVVVAAAGNLGVERLVPPASAPGAITVGGLDSRNSFDPRLWRLYHSNYGRVANALLKPEVIAPAVWLAAPMLPHTRVHNEGIFLWRLDKTIEQLLGSNGALPRARGENPHTQLEAARRRIRMRMIDQKYIHSHYQHVDGTSMAAPVVSAIIALMLEVNPSLTPHQVKEILLETALPLENFPAERRGAGLVNAGRAVAAARRTSRGIWHILPFSPHVEREEISFYYFDPSNKATRVALIGDFNGWDPHGYALHTRSPGFWQLSIPRLPGGSYRYKFLTDDRWVHDPENPNRIEDGYGSFSSRLEVPE